MPNHWLRYVGENKLISRYSAGEKSALTLAKGLFIRHHEYFLFTKHNVILLSGSFIAEIFYLCLRQPAY